MKIRSLKIHGIGWLHNEIDFPVEQLGDAAVVAITGLNGAGKTSICECIPGLIYGETPSHGAVAAMANEKNSYIEGVIETDQPYRLRRAINAALKTPKIEAYVWDEDGKPIGGSDGKQTTFSEEVEKKFPSKAVYLASGFASQGRVGQFLEIKKSERKALFADLLGLEYLQQLSQKAGDRAKKLESQLSNEQSKIYTLVEQAKKKDDLEKQVIILKKELDARRAELEKSETEAKISTGRLDEWKQFAVDLDKQAAKAKSDLESRKQHYKYSNEQLTKLSHDIAKMQSEIASLEKSLSQKTDLMSTISDVDLSRLPEIEREKAEILKALDDHRMSESEWRNKKDVAERALNLCREAYKDKLEKAKKNLDLAKARYESTKKAAEGLSGVPCHGIGEYASCPLIKTATEAARAIENEKRAVSKAEADVSKAKADTADGMKAKAELDSIGDPPVRPDTSKIDILDQEAGGLRSKQTEVVKAKAKLEALQESEERLGLLTTGIGPLLEQQSSGEDALADMARDVAEAEGKLLAVNDKRADHEKTKPDVTDLDLSDLRRLESGAVEALARTESQLSFSINAAGEVKEINVIITALSADIDDWRHIQKSFGREGIQSLEVDAAGPEVSRLINELLESCYSSRFNVRLETTALTTDGKGSKEIFDLLVVDTEKGWEGSASNLSGGEKVLVAEALGLAIAIYNAQQSSIPILDLIRDECSGALDFEKAPMYVAMLRRAVNLGKFHRVYFIAHQKDLWDMADARIEVADGQCRMVS